MLGKSFCLEFPVLQSRKAPSITFWGREKMFLFRGFCCRVSGPKSLCLYRFFFSSGSKGGKHYLDVQGVSVFLKENRERNRESEISSQEPLPPHSPVLMATYEDLNACMAP